MEDFITATETMTVNTSLAPVVTSHEDATCSIFRFVYIGLVFGVICVLGFAGNTLSLLVYARDGSSPIASLQLRSLAVADNCFLFLWLLHYSVREVLAYLGVNLWPITLVRMATFPVLFMAQFATIWLTVSIAATRFVAVCLPYHAPSLTNIANVRRVIAGVVVTSVIYNLPRFFELRPDFDTQQIRRTALGSSDRYAAVYTDVMYYCVTFFVPLTLLAVLNTCVIVRYRRIIARRKQMTSTRSRANANGGTHNGSTQNGAGRENNDNNITLVMIVVIAVFMICQAPARGVQMSYAYQYNTCAHAKFFLIHVSNSLEVVNSSINFVIYVAFRYRFLNMLRRHICRCPCCQSGSNDAGRTLTTEGLPLVEYPQPTSLIVNGQCDRAVSKTPATQYTDAPATPTSTESNENSGKPPTLEEKPTETG